MAEFCKECFKRCIVPGALDKYITISNDKDLCEGCGELKQVVLEYNPTEVEMYNPCFECLNRYGRQYTDECDDTCEYANALSKLKLYGGIDEAVRCMKGDAIPVALLRKDNIDWLRGVIRFVDEERGVKK